MLSYDASKTGNHKTAGKRGAAQNRSRWRDFCLWGRGLPDDQSLAVKNKVNLNKNVIKKG